MPDLPAHPDLGPARHRPRVRLRQLAEAESRSRGARHGSRPESRCLPGGQHRRLDGPRGTLYLALVEAAAHGQTGAVRFMLDAGFHLEARGEDGATPLHAAAFSGSADTAALLISRGADLGARDTTWDSTPLDWAKVGSGLRQAGNPDPDWIATIQALIEAGASTSEITLSADDPKPPSPEVAQLLRSYGIPSQ